MRAHSSLLPPPSARSATGSDVAQCCSSVCSVQPLDISSSVLVEHCGCYSSLDSLMESQAAISRQPLLILLMFPNLKNVPRISPCSVWRMVSDLSLDLP